MIAGNRVLGHADVLHEQGLEDAFREDDALARKRADHVLRDVRAHPRQALGLVLRRDGLVLVIVVAADLGLADPLQRAVPVRFRQHPYLEPPVRRDPVDSGEIGLHRELARQRVPETVEVDQQRLAARDGQQRPQQRRHEQARDAAVHAVGHPRVVALRELEPQRRMHDRVAQPGQQFAVVSRDVAVVHGQHVAPRLGEDQAVGDPAGEALPRDSGQEPGVAQAVEHLDDARPVEPDDTDALAGPAEQVSSAGQALRRRPPEADHHRVEVPNPAQVIDDVPEGRPVQFVDQARQHQRHRFGHGEPLEIPLQLVHSGVPEPVEGRHHPGLIEIRHRRPPRPE